MSNYMNNELKINIEYHKGLFEVKNNELIIFNKNDNNWTNVEFDKITRIAFQRKDIDHSANRKIYDVGEIKVTNNQITFTLKERNNGSKHS